MEKKEILVAFLELLREKCGFKFNVNSFEDRFKLQKYVFIAGFLGLRHGYIFSRYIRGPYSSSLAEDYYELTTPVESKRAEDYSCLGIDVEKLLDVIGGKSSYWLEIAATIFSVWGDYCEVFTGEELKKRVISTAKEIKSPMFSKDIPEVFAELEKKGYLKPKIPLLS